jgi:hypothetical protein
MKPWNEHLERSSAKSADENSEIRHRIFRHSGHELPGVCRAARCSATLSPDAPHSSHSMESSIQAVARIFAFAE